MQKIIRIGLTDISVSKPPFIEYEFDKLYPHWRCWTTYNQDLSSGVYITLYNDGSMFRVTKECGKTIDLVSMNSKV